MRLHNAAESRRSAVTVTAVNHHQEDGMKEEQYVKNYNAAKHNTLKPNNLVKQEIDQQQHKGEKEGNDYSYMMEVWPMAPPPGLVSGTSTYPRSASKNNYGSTVQGTLGRPRSAGHNELEEQRHIYDSPKTMRKLDNGPRYFELNHGKQYKEEDEDTEFDAEDDHRHS